MMWGWLSKQDQIIHTLTIKQQVKYSWKSSACWECSNNSIQDAFDSSTFVFALTAERGQWGSRLTSYKNTAKATHVPLLTSLWGHQNTTKKIILLWFRASWWFVKQRLYMEAGQRSCGKVRGVSQCNSLRAPTPFRHAAWSSVTPLVRVSLCGNVLYDCFASCFF